MTASLDGVATVMPQFYKPPGAPNSVVMLKVTDLHVSWSDLMDASKELCLTLSGRCSTMTQITDADPNYEVCTWLLLCLVVFAWHVSKVSE